MQAEFGPSYLNKLRAEYPAIPGRADYCVYFFYRAHLHLKANGRAGLVGTNTIRENDSRVGGLDYIVDNGGTITDAISTQDWSGDAAVHVSIVNWIKGTDKRTKTLSRQREDMTWEVIETAKINSALSFSIDVSKAWSLLACNDPKYCAQGQTPGHEGFLIDAATAQAYIAADPAYADVLFPLLTGDEMLSNVDCCPPRYVIDFGDMDLFSAQKFTELFNRVKTTVLPDRESAAKNEADKNAKALSDNPKAKVNKHHHNFLSKWWRLSYGRGELMKTLRTLPRVICCARIAKRQIFTFVNTGIHPNDVLMVFPFPDDYSFGIMQSSIHWAWTKARCSTLEERIRYTSDTVFDSFVWPQKPKKKSIDAVAQAAVHVRSIRAGIAKRENLCLRDMYALAEGPGQNALTDAHRVLDEAVRSAYGMDASDNAVAFMLALNAKCHELELHGMPVGSPGFPEDIVAMKDYVTTDCISMKG